MITPEYRSMNGWESRAIGRYTGPMIIPKCAVIYASEAFIVDNTLVVVLKNTVSNSRRTGVEVESGKVSTLKRKTLHSESASHSMACQYAPTVTRKERYTLWSTGFAPNDDFLAKDLKVVHLIVPAFNENRISIHRCIDHRKIL